MIKMLVCSFYNTLINEEEAISVESMLEIDRIRKNNTIITLATNRHYIDILYYNKDYPFIDYIIALNGSIIYDVKNNNELYSKKLSNKTIELIEKNFKNNKKRYYTKEKILSEMPSEDIYKIEIEITKKDNDKIEQLSCNKSILEINKKKYLEIVEYSFNESILTLMKKLKIKQEEIEVIIGNESEKDIIDDYTNLYITKRCSNILKKFIKNTGRKTKQYKIEELLKKL